MVCYYHPDRESTDKCAICGKSICKECGLEIAGKIYCKECLEKIVGIGIQEQSQPEPANTIQTEPEQNIKEVEENIYQPKEEYSVDEFLQEEIYSQEPETASLNSGISEDSPYNIRDNLEYDKNLESSYLDERERGYQPQQASQVTPNEIDYTRGEIPQQPEKPQEYIYPDHNYTPEPTSARRDLEDRYEKYLDDLYFEDAEVPLEEQLAKDEEQYGSLTRKKYAPRPEDPIDRTAKQQPPRYETPEEMEARIRAEIAREQQSGKPKENIHNLNYKDENESMGVVDILLTVILIIVILIVIYYLVFLFILSASYPTFMDAVFALQNPQNVINALLTQ